MGYLVLIPMGLFAWLCVKAINYSVGGGVGVGAGVGVGVGIGVGVGVAVAVGVGVGSLSNPSVRASVRTTATAIKRTTIIATSAIFIDCLLPFVVLSILRGALPVNAVGCKMKGHPLSGRPHNPPGRARLYSLTTQHCL